MSEPVYVTGRSYQIDYLCGWRFIFSRRFRERIRRQWGDSTWKKIACVLGGLVGIVLSSVFVLFFVLCAWCLATG